MADDTITSIEDFRQKVWNNNKETIEIIKSMLKKIKKEEEIDRYHLDKDDEKAKEVVRWCEQVFPALNRAFEYKKGPVAKQFANMQEALGHEREDFLKLYHYLYEEHKELVELYNIAVKNAELAKDVNEKDLKEKLKEFQANNQHKGALIAKIIEQEKNEQQEKKTLEKAQAITKGATTAAKKETGVKAKLKKRLEAVVVKSVIPYKYLMNVCNACRNVLLDDSLLKRITNDRTAVEFYGVKKVINYKGNYQFEVQISGNVVKTVPYTRLAEVLYTGIEPESKTETNFIRLEKLVESTAKDIEKILPRSGITQIHKKFSDKIIKLKNLILTIDMDEHKREALIMRFNNEIIKPIYDHFFIRQKFNPKTFENHLKWLVRSGGLLSKPGPNFITHGQYQELHATGSVVHV